MENNWRFIDTDFCSASYNMALDEAIATTVRKGSSTPTLRLYGWNVPSVSIGYFQKVRDIDFDYCIEKSIPIVRRPTGGRAILHNNEITYSFSVKTGEGIFSKGLLDSYRRISAAFVLALSKIGLSPELKLIRETRRTKSPLCFKSVSYGECIIDRDEMAKVFRLQSSVVVENIIGLQETLYSLNHKDLKNAIRVSFEEIFNMKLIPSPPSREEISLAEELETMKYLSPHWNFQR